MKAETLATEALVLRRFDFGETSQTGRLFTRGLGRLSVLARGSKRGGPDLRGPLDLFARAEVELRLRHRSDLHLLLRYRVITGHPGLRRNLERLAAAFYLTEILREGTRDEDPAPELYDLTISTLGALESFSSTDVPLAVAFFELHFLRLSGFLPRFRECVLCDREAPPRGPVRFSLARGGLICQRCATGKSLALTPLTFELRGALEELLRASRVDRLQGLVLGSGGRVALRRLLPAVMEKTLERELRAAPFVRP